MIESIKQYAKNYSDPPEKERIASRGFIIEKMYRSPSRISLARLRSCLAILRDTAMKLNSTGGDEKIVLQQAVAKMLALKN